MAYPAFPTLGYEPYGPIAPGSNKKATPAVLTATFGGRYVQRTGDGVNALPTDVAFRSITMPRQDIQVLEAFLIGRKGYLPFTYQVPYETIPRQFICSEWTVNYDDPLNSSLSATFAENFDP